MRYNITGTSVGHVNIKLPSSKSISNRALILNGISKSPYEIDNLSDCDDTKVMIKAFKDKNHLIDVGAAGTSMRFLTAYLSQLPGEWSITGSKRMQERPIKLLVDALNSLGANIKYAANIGFPPLQIEGRTLNGGEIYLSGGTSSQFVSALLMVAPYMTKGLTIHLEGDVISIPYIKLTLGMMAQYGVRTNWVNNTIKIHPETYKPIPYKVESDWSGASYWYEIAALSKDAKVELLGLFKDSMQGDSKVAELFLDLGIDTEYTDKGVVLTKSNRLTKKFFHNFVNEPDLAQTFAVTCCMLDIPFLFTGLQSLKIKETDRILALKNELCKLGYVLHDSNDSILEWDGERCEPEENPVIKTYEDHRMAMAFAPAALKVKNILIEEPMVVTKSYPNYWKDLEIAGFNVKELD